MALFAGPLIAAITQAAPRVRLRFTQKPVKDARPLREGEIDLEIGTPGLTAPELRTQLLFRDSFVGAVRAGHDVLTGPMTPERYAACRHVVASRKDVALGPVDAALNELGLRRDIAAIVPGFPDAMRVARQTDLVALVPKSSIHLLPEGISSFALPIRTPELAVSAMWHPRLDADPAQQWFRAMVAAVCRATLEPR